MPGKYRETLVREAVNMPLINRVIVDCIERAFLFSIKCPKATIPECMMSCGFTRDEAEDKTKRAVIYRRLKKVGRAANDNYVTDVVVEDGALSSVTTSLYDIIVPGEEDEDPILHGPPPMLEPTMAGTYVRYPYLVFHYNRAPRLRHMRPH